MSDERKQRENDYAKGYVKGRASYEAVPLVVLALCLAFLLLV